MYIVEENIEQEKDEGAEEEEYHSTDADTSQDEPVEESGGKDTAEKIYDQLNSEEIRVSSMKDLKELKEAYDKLEKVVKRNRKDTETPDY